MKDYSLKLGDRVRHRADGWLGFVREVRLNTVLVKSDDGRTDGEFSNAVLEKVDDEDN